MKNLRKLDTTHKEKFIALEKYTYQQRNFKRMSISTVKFYKLVREFNLPNAPRVDSGTPKETKEKSEQNKKKKEKKTIDSKAKKEIENPNVTDYTQGRILPF